MAVAQLRVVLVLIEDWLESVILPHELVQLRRAHRQNRDEIFDFDDLDVHNWLHIIDLDNLVELVNYREVSLAWLRHVAPMQDVAAGSTEKDLEQVVLEHLDVNRLDDHLVDRTISLLEVLRCEDVDSKNEVAIPVIVEEFGVADEETVGARLVDEHASDPGAHEMARVIHNLLAVSHGRCVLAQHLLADELVSRSEDPETIVLEGDLLVDRLRRWVPKCDVLHCERAIETHFLLGKAVFILGDDISGAESCARA